MVCVVVGIFYVVVLWKRVFPLLTQEAFESRFVKSFNVVVNRDIGKSVDVSSQDRIVVGPLIDLSLIWEVFAFWLCVHPLVSG